jgi:ABC-2 type transport system permease protein
MAKYSNMRAMRALVKASLLGIVKSPSAVVFTIAFPLIFILVFGFLGGNGIFSIRVANHPGSDTTNMLYKVLHQVDALRWVEVKDTVELQNMFNKGELAATIAIKEMPDGVIPHFDIKLHSPSTEVDKARQLQAMINSIVLQMNPEAQAIQARMGTAELRVDKIREYKTIDFILPGQLSFSLLAAGVFGTAFVFYNLRQTLVLKRFFATPVKREIIVLSEGISRMVFQIISAVIIIAIGYFAFGFTLAHGFVTFAQILVLCAIGLLLFMGFGFIISSVAKSEGAIPPFSNLVTLPQFLLAGTFFPIDVFPKWLQPVSRSLPLTYLNHALRKISFEGVTLWDVREDVLILLIWMVVVYIVAAKMFKWE